MQAIKRWIWNLLRQAGYTVLHNETYFALRARHDDRTWDAEVAAGAAEGLAAAEDVRPLKAVTLHDYSNPTLQITPASVAAIATAPGYSDVFSYFSNYPPRSLMSDHSRATLYSLVRIMRPKAVAEIGTLFAGTTEVIARALWENGEGVVHSTDPFGAQRCPAIIRSWPLPLRKITKYHSLNSMDFFAEVESRQIVFDIVLVDGNHDFEFALFDLLEAAKLLRPGGVIVMDNAEQTGPYQAARTFLANRPGWLELGSAVASFDIAKPFDETRASVHGTSFVLLKAPEYLPVGPSPQSWGQAPVSINRVTGISFDAIAQTTSGILHYQAIFRAFADANRDVVEMKSVGSMPVVLAGDASQIVHAFRTPLTCDIQSRHRKVEFTFEIELAWQADHGAPPLAIKSVPSPIAKN